MGKRTLEDRLPGLAAYGQPIARGIQSLTRAQHMETRTSGLQATSSGAKRTYSRSKADMECCELLTVQDVGKETRNLFQVRVYFY